MPETKKAHLHLGWAFSQINGLIYFLDFFAFALIALAATFGFAAFVLIAIDSPPLERRRTLRLTALPAFVAAFAVFTAPLVVLRIDKAVPTIGTIPKADTRVALASFLTLGSESLLVKPLFLLRLPITISGRL